MKSSILRIWALGRLIIVDGVRRQAVLGLVVLALCVELSGLFFFAFVPRDILRVSSDFVVSVGWCAGMVFLLFHAVGLMSWGEDRRVIHTLLARPISRTEYVFGVFLGLFLLLMLLNLLLSVTGYGILLLIKSWLKEGFFGDMEIGGYMLAWGGVLSIEAMILSVVVLFSGLIRGTFTVLLMTLSYYFICTGLPVAIEFFKGSSEAIRKLMLGMTLAFPNFSRFDYKGLISAFGTWPTPTTFAINFAYVLLYCALSLVFASWVYNRRDLK